MYPEAGIEPDTLDIEKLRKALELVEYPVGGNAAFLLHEGRSDDEVKQYLIKYSMLTDERCAQVSGVLEGSFPASLYLHVFLRKTVDETMVAGT